MEPPPWEFSAYATAQSAYVSVPIGDGIFSSVLFIVHILHFVADLGIGGPLHVGGLSQHPH